MVNLSLVLSAKGRGDWINYMRFKILFFYCLLAPALLLEASANTADPESTVKNPGNSMQKNSTERGDVNAQSSQSSAARRAIAFRSLSQLDELIDAGVPALALSLLEQEQKKRPLFTADWYAFEYKRAAIYLAKSDWAALDNRVDWLFETAVPDKQITEKIRLWFETQQVIARLRAGFAEQALHQLRALIWKHDVTQIDKSLPVVWRRLIIRAYVQLAMEEDAQKALVKYNRDYTVAKTDIDWLLLQAHILLKTERPYQAEKLLASVPDEQRSDGIEALRYLAQLQRYVRSSDRKAALKKTRKVVKTVRKKLDGKLLSPSARWAYSYVAYRAALVLNDVPSQIANLESMLSLALDYQVLGEDYVVTADDLWQLYESEGLLLSNEYNLLVGDDAAWLALIKKLKKHSAQKAFYVEAALALNAQSDISRKQAHTSIVAALQKKRNGLELISQLYLHAGQIADFSVIPEGIRYQLIDYTLSEGDISQAAKLMKTLDEPPAGQDIFDWRMRKARVMVLEGEYDESAALLTRTIEEVTLLPDNTEKPVEAKAKDIEQDVEQGIVRETGLDDQMIDRYIQVLFDFQTVQQHQHALRLFDLLKPDWLSDKLKREIYFWKAESFYVLEFYDQSALFYLKSATAIKEQEHDLWAQSARFKAAGALVKAGLYDDAETVYKELFVVTASDSRKALIKQNLQKIRLLRHAQHQ